MAQNQAGLDPLCGALNADDTLHEADWWSLADPTSRPRAVGDVGFEPEFMETDDAQPFYAKMKPDGSPIGKPVQANFQM